MDKKCTLIAAALMVAGVFSANVEYDRSGGSVESR